MVKTLPNHEVITPWDFRNGIWYKREDLHRAPNGVNGAKYRACRHLITTAVVEHGVSHIVTAQSVRSPQAAITATLCEELGLECTVVVGASKPETAVKHPSIALAVAAGAELDCTPRMAYNNVIQPYAERLARKLGGWQLPYAISPPENAAPEAVRAFLEVGGAQAQELPPGLRTLVIPFGSGNTTAGVLYGLHKYGHSTLQKVVLVGVGPDRWAWVLDRLATAGVSHHSLGPVERITLHGWYANYEDLMPETVDDIVMHPTYEGKVIRWLNQTRPDYWINRDGTTGFWIVGGPL